MIWPFRPRSYSKSTPRSRRLEFERLEDRNLLSGDLLLTAQDPGVIVYRLLEYTQAGSLVSSTLIPPASSEYQDARGLTVDSSSNIDIYNGTFTPYLSTYVAASHTWTKQTFAGWDTIGNGSYGGVAAYQNFVFASDMSVLGDAKGIVRFDNSGGPTIRFATDQDFIDV